MTNKVYVGNLPFSITEADLGTFLTELGLTFNSIKVITDRVTGRSRGFAFVEFDTPTAASAAIAELGGTLCQGRPLFASEAKDNRSRGEARRTSEPSPQYSPSPRLPDFQSEDRRRRRKEHKPSRGNHEFE